MERDLENHGFADRDYIVYLNHENPEVGFVVSTKVNDDSQAIKAEEIYNKYDVRSKFMMDNTNLEDASYENICKQLEINAKMQIHNASGINVKGTSNGMDSEVKA